MRDLPQRPGVVRRGDGMEAGGMSDLELPLGPLVVVEHDADLSLPERYAAWIAANGWVVEALAVIADEIVARGQTRLSVDGLCHVLRWEHGKRLVFDTEGFALNNSYVAFLSRDLLAARPDLASYIRTRRQKAA